MAQLEPLRDDIRKTGASLVYVAAQTRGGIFDPVKYLAAHPVTFPFLLDEDRAVTKAYGVYHLIGLDAYNIARPSTFVVGRDGLIQYIHVGSSQTDRAPVEDIFTSLKQRRRVAT